MGNSLMQRATDMVIVISSKNMQIQNRKQIQRILTSCAAPLPALSLRCMRLPRGSLPNYPPVNAPADAHYRFAAKTLLYQSQPWMAPLLQYLKDTLSLRNRLSFEKRCSLFRY